MTSQHLTWIAAGLFAMLALLHQDEADDWLLEVLHNRFAAVPLPVDKNPGISHFVLEEEETNSNG